MDLILEMFRKYRPFYISLPISKDHKNECVLYISLDEWTYYHFIKTPDEDKASFFIKNFNNIHLTALRGSGFSMLNRRNVILRFSSFIEFSAFVCALKTNMYAFYENIQKTGPK